MAHHRVKVFGVAIAYRSGRRATRSGKPSTTSIAISSRKSRDGVEKSSHARPFVFTPGSPSRRLKWSQVLGIDLGKNVCSVVGLDPSGAVVLRRRVRRDTLIDLVAKLPSCIVGME